MLTCPKSKALYLKLMTISHFCLPCSAPILDQKTSLMALCGAQVTYLPNHAKSTTQYVLQLPLNNKKFDS